jgi:hypothetical protein
MPTKIQKKIILPHGWRREIAHILGINERTVGLALKGEITGKKSAAARQLAEAKLKEFNLTDNT